MGSDSDGEGIRCLVYRVQGMVACTTFSKVIGCCELQATGLLLAERTRNGGDYQLREIANFDSERDTNSISTHKPE